ncbi:serine hydrolase domain-containing protein [Stenotrophomonas sp. Iso1]|uniref:serine hydrolase domain-containing protein n=1 Tax=Stenotrophomonas sp. Iso1 TaxID=2977283 RepID=UPI0022B7C77D|nr:serine hydrolase domain-containing protein [Stenotrophomonas sp. Iso1]
MATTARCSSRWTRQASGASRLFFGLSLVLGATLSANASADNSLDPILTAAMEGTQTPAVAMLVIRDDKVERQSVRGVRRNDSTVAAQTDDVWLIGSTGKPMTVALIARLAEQGLLDWEAPLSKMLPDLTTINPVYSNITLTQLLSHRAGLPENLQDAAALDAFFTDTRALPVQREAYIRAALQEAPVNVPGNEFAYSNSGFLIAAVIAERVTGTDFETLMRREVFEPLGMDSAGFGPTSADQPQGHRAGKPVTTAPQKSDDGVPPMYTPAGNVHMRLQDMAKFAIDQMAGSRGKGKLLTPASYRLMQTPQSGSPSAMDWGVQPSIAGRRGPVLTHGGSDGNWLAWVALFPESGNGLIAIANAAEDMGADKATMGAMGPVFAELAPPAAAKP